MMEKLELYEFVEQEVSGDVTVLVLDCLVTVTRDLGLDFKVKWTLDLLLTRQNYASSLCIVCSLEFF